MRGEAAADGVVPAGRGGEVDLLEDRVQALAGTGAARKAQDVVRRDVRRRRADALRQVCDSRVVVVRGGFAFRVAGKARKAAAAPRGRDRFRRGQGSEGFRFGARQRDRRAAFR
jgi:hypothetical protein